MGVFYSDIVYSVFRNINDIFFIAAFLKLPNTSKEVILLRFSGRFWRIL